MFHWIISEKNIIVVAKTIIGYNLYCINDDTRINIDLFWTPFSFFRFFSYFLKLIFSIFVNFRLRSSDSFISSIWRKTWLNRNDSRLLNKSGLANRGGHHWLVKVPARERICLDSRWKIKLRDFLRRLRMFKYSNKNLHHICQSFAKSKYQFKVTNNTIKLFLVVIISYRRFRAKVGKGQGLVSGFKYWLHPSPPDKGHFASDWRKVTWARSFVTNSSRIC